MLSSMEENQDLNTSKMNHDSQQMNILTSGGDMMNTPMSMGSLPPNMAGIGMNKGQTPYNLAYSSYPLMSNQYSIPTPGSYMMAQPMQPPIPSYNASNIGGYPSMYGHNTPSYMNKGPMMTYDNRSYSLNTLEPIQSGAQTPSGYSGIPMYSNYRPMMSQQPILLPASGNSYHLDARNTQYFNRAQSHPETRSSSLAPTSIPSKTAYSSNRVTPHGSLSPETMNGDLNNKRNKILERNRLAAVRSRQKKKKELEALVKTLDEMEERHLELERQLKSARKERDELRKRLFAHKDCGCDVINTYEQLQSLHNKNRSSLNFKIGMEDTRSNSNSNSNNNNNNNNNIPHESESHSAPSSTEKSEQQEKKPLTSWNNRLNDDHATSETSRNEDEDEDEDEEFSDENEDTGGSEYHEEADTNLEEGGDTEATGKESKRRRSFPKSTQ